MTFASTSIGPTAVEFLGVVGNGLIRIPALKCAANAAVMTGELSVRLLAGIWTGVFGSPKAGGYASQAVEFVRANYRPYGSTLSGKYQIPTKMLCYMTLQQALSSALLNEGAFRLCGPIPRVYNDVLAIQGPIQISDHSWYGRMQDRFGGFLSAVPTKDLG
ncbi:MAG: hypothetical protein JSR46_11785 [Verrucomicrobia bacterium]|nr:hypothetical protein [Verrucomicrobiota bacterium]